VTVFLQFGFAERRAAGGAGQSIVTPHNALLCRLLGWRFPTDSPDLENLARVDIQKHK
jgi:hypothetical protein